MTEERFCSKCIINYELLTTTVLNEGWVAVGYRSLPFEVWTQREESMKHCRLKFLSPIPLRKTVLSHTFDETITYEILLQRIFHCKIRCKEFAKQ